MDAVQAILTRRSIRKYLDKAVPPDVLQQVLRAAMYALKGNMPLPQGDR